MAATVSRESDDETKTDVSNAFEAFGQQFLAQFGPMPSSRKRKAAAPLEGSANKRLKEEKEKTTTIEESEEEWNGIQSSDRDASSCSEASDDEIDDCSAIGSAATPGVPVVVFDGEQTTNTKTVSRTDKNFMSSKVAKLRTQASSQPSKLSKKEQAEELEYLENDRTLYKLIHTKLLSASLDKQSDMKGSKHKKSIEGRLLEIANAAQVGEGETSVRKEEHKKATRSIREGIKAKRKERIQQKIAEAKDMGNYHPTIKRLLKDSDKPIRHGRRERGIGGGVGSFRGGILNLRKEEIRKVQGTLQNAGKKRHF